MVRGGGRALHACVGGCLSCALAGWAACAMSCMKPSLASRWPPPHLPTWYRLDVARLQTRARQRPSFLSKVTPLNDRCGAR